MSKFNPMPKKGMPPKKTPKPLKRTAIKKKFKATGEKPIFQEVLDEVPYDAPIKCFVCKKQISVVTHRNFSHILPKKQYPAFRLNPENIKIMCFRFIADENGSQGCHYDWDFKPRSELKGEMWDNVKELEAELKNKYNEL